MKVNLKRRLDSGKTRNYDLKGSRVTIGRDRHNNISVDESWVSARHAIITCNRQGEFLIKDCQSRNGTYVNEVKVTTEESFQIGDVIRLGHADFEVVEKPPANAIPVVPLSERKKKPAKVTTP